MDFCSPRFLKINFVVLAALGLRGCAQSFSGCGEVFVAVMGFLWLREWLLIAEHVQAQ